MGPDFGDNKPLTIFSSNAEYFSMVICGILVNYCTLTWKICSVNILHLFFMYLCTVAYCILDLLFQSFHCVYSPSNFTYTEKCSVAVWNSIGDFVVYSLVGEQLFKRKQSVCSRVKAAKLCNENRIFIIVTYDDKVGN